MNYNQQKKAAQEFAARWAGKGDEKQDSQRFWFDLLQNVYGVDDPASRPDVMRQLCPIPNARAGLSPATAQDHPLLTERGGLLHLSTLANASLKFA